VILIQNFFIIKKIIIIIKILFYNKMRTNFYGKSLAIVGGSGYVGSHCAKVAATYK
jgi:hypothetical protein